LKKAAQSGARTWADPDLARIIAAWPTRPDSIRRAILAVLNTLSASTGR
jgi:hypothetical protein